MCLARGFFVLICVLCCFNDQGEQLDKQEQGKTLAKPIYDSIVRMQDGTFEVKKGEDAGLLSKSGKVIIKPGDMTWKRLENGFYLTEKKGKVGLLSPECASLAKPAYTSVASLVSGYWLVENEGRFGLLTDKGKLIVKPSYTSIRPIGEGPEVTFQALDANGAEVLLNAKGVPQK